MPLQKFRIEYIGKEEYKKLVAWYTLAIEFQKTHYQPQQIKQSQPLNMKTQTNKGP